jgi:hypothetical protein
VRHAQLLIVAVAWIAEAIAATTMKNAMMLAPITCCRDIISRRRTSTGLPSQ